MRVIINFSDILILTIGTDIIKKKKNSIIDKIVES